MLTLKRLSRLFLAACLLGNPLPAFNASADAVPAVNKLPRVALVIGNGRYRDVPLTNAPNDAKAIASHLERMGFDVTLKLDATRAEMVQMIRAFGARLGKEKGVGLFYFAGHGAQLAWRNYLIPVDAAIKTVAEVDAQAVDLDTLLESMGRARNAMNLIILDACRDNPFGGDVQVQQKGLSQVDAPPGTLLAYATAPGNVAADGVGTGTNGLYTEYILKEMQSPEAKIEDVFKRVRLNVRRQSRGQQIPWESTSLEEDFYFIPPKQARRLTLEEVERLFDEELALWEKIRTSQDPGPLEDYLRRYPSGKFSEVAQFRLDQVLSQLGEKPVQIADASRAVNPYSKGTAKANLNYAVGDQYTYRKLDLQTNAETTYLLRVTEVTPDQVVYNKGTQVRDLLGNALKTGRGDFAGTDAAGAQFYASEYSIGKKWTARYRFTARDGSQSSTEIDFRVVAREKITVPAGEFDAFKVEGKGSSTRSFSLQYTYWVAPDQVRRVIAFEETFRGFKTDRILLSARHELASFRQLR